MRYSISLDEQELRRAVERVRKLEAEWNYMVGIKQGFRIAEQRFQRQPKIDRKLKGARGKERARKVLVKILEEHPQWSIAEVFQEMDKRKVPMLAYGRVSPGKGSRKWSDVATEPVFKNLFTRERNEVRKNLTALSWEKIIKWEKDLRQQKLRSDRPRRTGVTYRPIA